MIAFLDPSCLSARRAFLLDPSGPKHSDRMVAEEHVESCEACRAFTKRERDTADSLKLAATWERTTDENMGRVPVVLRESSVRRRRWGTRHSMAALAAVVLLSCVFSGLYLLRRDRTGIAEAMFLDHLHYLEVAQPAYLVSSEPSVIETWTQKEFGFSPRISRPEGFDLLGARRCSVAGHAVALVFYQRGSRHASLFIGDADSWPKLPNAAGWRGMNLVSQPFQRLVYTAVGDLSQQDLEALLPAGPPNTGTKHNESPQGGSQP